MLVTLSLLALVGMATPAPAANGSGLSGSGEVKFTVTNQTTVPACATQSNQTESVNWSNATFRSGGLTYSGPATLNESFSGPVYANPATTYADPLCAVPSPAPTTATISGSVTGASVSCTFGTGRWSRQGVGDANVVATYVGNCTVTVGASVSTTSTVFEMRATLNGNSCQATPAAPNIPRDVRCPVSSAIYVAAA